MKLVLRWFPYGDDSVSLKQIKQIPGVSGVATHLTRIPVGDIWTMDEINLVKDEINSYGLEMEVIESLNIHEDIKKDLTEYVGEASQSDDITLLSIKYK